MRSWSSLQRMQSVVSGRASRRFTEISSPHSSQMPNVPSSIFFRAFSILSRKLFSLPRRRNVNDWRYSLDARSISSGRSSVSSAMSCSSVCFAFLRISSRLSVRSVLNFFSVALFTRALHFVERTRGPAWTSSSERLDFVHFGSLAGAPFVELGWSSVLGDEARGVLGRGREVKHLGGGRQCGHWRGSRGSRL